jgi:hypothetical protein
MICLGFVWVLSDVTALVIGKYQRNLRQNPDKSGANLIKRTFLVNMPDLTVALKINRLTFCQFSNLFQKKLSLELFYKFF